MGFNSLTWHLFFSRDDGSDCKPRKGILKFSIFYTVNKVLGNSVPAAAVKQRGRALNTMTGRKGCVGGYY